MLAAIVAVAVFLVFEARADASPYVQYGVQDDAWLLGGPGTSVQLCPRGKLGVPLRLR